MPGTANGCGDGSVKEEVKFYIASGLVNENVGYWTFTRFDKKDLNSGFRGNYEANWSFASLVQDWNLAKIGYCINNGGYNPSCANPGGVLSSYPGCP